MIRFSDISVLDFQIQLTVVLWMMPLLLFFGLISLGRIVRKYRGIAATSIMGLCSIVSFYLFTTCWNGDVHAYKLEWFQWGEHSLSVGIHMDPLTSVMLLIVCFVSFLVHLFSIEYLRGDRHFEKYFSFLGLFTFAMMGILLSSSLLQVFAFWELVGLSSYLLIGFYFEKDSAAYSSKKAFLVNRVGDVGFLIALLVVYNVFGTFDISTLASIISNGMSQFTSEQQFWLGVAGFGVFWGSIGKSAQFPLQIWLPNAMEGPTPVSALIHAATMVAAGVYLICRVNFLITPALSDFILIVGTITAFIGAFSAISQTDIKRVLAFSTISQLGYMMIAVGLGQYEVAVFHLLTHAFFKACLFLCAGAVIHSVHQVEEYCLKKGMVCHFDAQDMRFMGGLRKKMPVTFLCYTIAAASLAGLPLFSGFLSKDAILLYALDHGIQAGGWYVLVPIVGFVAALLTAFYMARQLYMVFFQEFRLPKWRNEYKEAASQITETPWLMRVPIMVLAALSMFFVFSLNPFSGESSWLLTDLLPVRTELHFVVAGLSLVMAAAGIGIAYYYFGRKDFILEKIEKPISERNIITRLSFNHLYINEVYNWVVIQPVLIKSKLIHFTDKRLIDGVVNTMANVQPLLGKAVAFFDARIVDGAVNLFGTSTVLFGYVVKGVDQYVVDPAVHMPALIAKGLGRLFKNTVSNNVQMLITGSFIMILILASVLIYLAF